MNHKKLKRNAVLGILFFLPVVFLLFLYPASHNYNPLDVVHNNVKDLDLFTSSSEEPILLKDHITVLMFLGSQPMDYTIAASNLKELVYDKFKGFKKFQIVIVSTKGTEAQTVALQKEINTYEDMRFWHYVFAESNDIQNLFNSLKSEEKLNQSLASDHVFIVDKDLNQRGRLDDREERQKELNKPKVALYSYDCIEVAEIKNKMSDDLRILFTEYRQKRKGEFDSSSRRAEEIK